MATDFLQQVQSAMQGKFMTDPVLTAEVCHVVVDEHRTMAVSLLQVPSEVGMVATYLLTDHHGNPHRDRVIYTMDEYDLILDYIAAA
jgi:hypothetical protein|tara:strand:+ start:71 stop:331 length:261 start_codon:yes stop_codon:yes gene_type:complete